MRSVLFIFIFFMTFPVLAQESDEFVETIIDDKEAFLSTETGEFVFLPHEKTNASYLRTTESGVVYKEVKTHKVKAGESLFVIAKKYSTTVSELKSQNKLSSNNLKIGQSISITKKMRVKSSSPVLNKSEGTIIARLAPGQTPNGMTPPDLPPDAMPGNTINLVTDKSTPIKRAQIEEKAVETIDGNTIHTVKRGESLYSIARKYKMSIPDLKALNNLALSNLTPGQKLKISIYNPEIQLQNQAPDKISSSNPAIDKIKSPILKTDTNEVVADSKEAKEDIKVASEKESAKVNDSVSSKISAKEALKEKTNAVEKDLKVNPNQEKAIEEPKEQEINELINKYKKEDANKSETDDASIYVVKKGDNLWSIAKRLHISIKDLKELNNLETDALAIGQKLKLK